MVRECDVAGGCRGGNEDNCVTVGEIRSPKATAAFSPSSSLETTVAGRSTVSIEDREVRISTLMEGVKKRNCAAWLENEIGVCLKQLYSSETNTKELEKKLSELIKNSVKPSFIHWNTIHTVHSSSASACLCLVSHYLLPNKSPLNFFFLPVSCLPWAPRIYKVLPAIWSPNILFPATQKVRRSRTVNALKWPLVNHMCFGIHKNVNRLIACISTFHYENWEFRRRIVCLCKSRIVYQKGINNYLWMLRFADARRRNARNSNERTSDTFQCCHVTLRFLPGIPGHEARFRARQSLRLTRDTRKIHREL